MNKIEVPTEYNVSQYHFRQEILLEKDFLIQLVSNRSFRMIFTLTMQYEQAKTMLGINLCIQSLKIVLKILDNST